MNDTEKKKYQTLRWMYRCSQTRMKHASVRWEATERALAKVLRNVEKKLGDPAVTAVLKGTNVVYTRCSDGVHAMVDSRIGHNKKRKNR
jgi:hypothetical protein